MVRFGETGEASLWQVDQVEGIDPRDVPAEVAPVAVVPVAVVPAVVVPGVVVRVRRNRPTSNPRRNRASRFRA
jgi:hypothetical protein